MTFTTSDAAAARLGGVFDDRGTGSMWLHINHTVTVASFPDLAKVSLPTRHSARDLNPTRTVGAGVVTNISK